MRSPSLSTIGYGNTFLEDTKISPTQLDNLFFLLITSILAILLIGNMLFLDLHILKATLAVTATCLMLVAILYTATRITGKVPWGFLCSYGFLFGVAYYQTPLLNIVFYIIGGISCLYTLKYLRPSDVRHWSFLTTPLVTAVTVLGAPKIYTSFNMLSRFAVGNVHQDTLFHASISAMFKNYGVISTGLHGLVETPYHIFSHCLIAGLSLLSGIGVFEVYGIATSLLFTPILLFTLVVVCVAFNSQQNPLNIGFLWILGCLLLTLLPSQLSKFMTWNSYFGSESYTVALAIFLACLPILWSKNISYTDLICVSLLTLCIGFAKMSVGAMFMGLWWTRCLFFRKESLKTLLATSLVTVMAAIPIFTITQGGGLAEAIDPFGTIRDFSYWGQYIRKFGVVYATTTSIHPRYLLGSIACMLLYIAFHFLISWIPIIQHTRKGFKGILASPVSLYSLSAIGGSLLLTSIFNFPGGASYYFTNVALFVSLPTCILLLYTYLNKKSFSPFPSKIPVLICIVSLLAFAIPNLKTMKKLARRHTPTNIATTSCVGTLLDIQRNAPRNICIMASREVLDTNPISRLSAKPFVYPAISERSWTKIIPPPPEQAVYLWYGYTQYGLTPENQILNIPPKLNFNEGVLQLSPVDDVIRLARK